MGLGLEVLLTLMHVFNMRISTAAYLGRVRGKG